jgi:hypothetical protein
MYKTILVPVVLYGYETWSLTLREELRLRVFENRALRRILGPKRDEVAGEWRKLHNEELNDMYLRNFIRVIKSRRIRWAWHVARIGRVEVRTGYWWGNEGRGNLEDPGVDGRIGCIFRKWNGRIWTGLIWLRVSRSCRHL